MFKYLAIVICFIAVLAFFLLLAEEFGERLKRISGKFRTKPTGTPLDVLDDCCDYDGEIFVICADCRNFALGTPDDDTDVFAAQRFFKAEGPLRYCGTTHTEDWETYCPSCDQLSAQGQLMFVYHP